MDTILLITFACILGCLATAGLAVSLFWWFTRNGKILYIQNMHDLLSFIGGDAPNTGDRDRTRRYVDALRRLNANLNKEVQHVKSENDDAAQTKPETHEVYHDVDQGKINTLHTNSTPTNILHTTTGDGGGDSRRLAKITSREVHHAG